MIVVIKVNEISAHYPTIEQLADMVIMLTRIQTSYVD